MTDRELLEAAAKAAGIRGEWGPVLPLVDCSDMFMLLEEGSEEVGIWNPLTDDGDALRLAVRLSMTVAIDCESMTVTAVFYCGRIAKEPCGNPGEAMAATRRAIVRCAVMAGELLATQAAKAAVREWDDAIGAVTDTKGRQGE